MLGNLRHYQMAPLAKHQSSAAAATAGTSCPWQTITVGAVRSSARFGDVPRSRRDQANFLLKLTLFNQPVIAFFIKPAKVRNTIKTPKRSIIQPQISTGIP